MTDIAAAGARSAEGFAVRRIGRRWSRQASTLAIIGLSLLGWAALGALPHVLNL